MQVFGAAGQCTYLKRSKVNVFMSLQQHYSQCLTIMQLMWVGTVMVQFVVNWAIDDLGYPLFYMKVGQ